MTEEILATAEEPKPAKRENKLMTALEASNARLAELEAKLEAIEKNKSKVFEAPAVYVKKPDDEIVVKGIFNNKEQPTNPVHRFLYGPSNAIKMYKFEAGVATETPLSIAKHLEHACAVNRYDGFIKQGSEPDGMGTNITHSNGEMIPKVVGKKSRFGFTPPTASGGW